MNRNQRDPALRVNIRRITARRKQRIVSLLLKWYKKHQRPFPWRNERDPYRVLVSEIMLQQTQVSRVALLYPRFVSKFPSYQSLARARRSSVIKKWKGMGYNNRAVRLQETARKVVSEFGGSLPKTVEELRTLPGVGQYTAHAIASFAFGLRVPVVDTNIARVFGRLFANGPASDKMSAREAWSVASAMLPTRNSSDWHQALMDLGSTICTASSPICAMCPLRLTCRSANAVVRIPRRLPRQEPGRNGIPNRIYRGRIVETLRLLKRDESMPLDALGRSVLPRYRRKDRSWLEKLLSALQRDGIIARSRSDVMLAN